MLRVLAELFLPQYPLGRLLCKGKWFIFVFLFTAVIPVPRTGPGTWQMLSHFLSNNKQIRPFFRRGR